MLRPDQDGVGHVHFNPGGSAWSPSARITAPSGPVTNSAADCELPRHWTPSPGRTITSLRMGLQRRCSITDDSPDASYLHLAESYRRSVTDSAGDTVHALVDIKLNILTNLLCRRIR